MTGRAGKLGLGKVGLDQGRRMTRLRCTVSTPDTVVRRLGAISVMRQDRHPGVARDFGG